MKNESPRPNNILPKLSKYLFWDCNISALDPNADKNLILERVFSRGTENDEKEVFNYYGMTVIKESVLNIKYLDKKTLNYLSIILDIPREDFRCYKKTLSENPYGVCRALAHSTKIFAIYRKNLPC
jgi:hypothetical protein